MYKINISFIIIFLLSLQIAYSSNVIVKFDHDIDSGYIDCIKELGLYLFNSENVPKGYKYKENDSLLEIQSSVQDNEIDPYRYEQSYLYNLNIEDLYVENPCKVAILDTGVDIDHSDLDVSGDDDLNGHGTAVAGIIGAVKNNSIGISGIADNNIVSIRIIGKTGVSRYFKLMKGIIRACSENIRLIGIFSGGTSSSKALKEVIDYAFDRGCIIIAAGGNTNSETVLYPAAYDNVISVGSINNEGKRCTYNDWGYKNGIPLGSCYSKNVDFMMPGVNIFTTKIDNNYGNLKGTSASAAILTGIASYVLACENTITYSEMIKKLHDIIETGIDNRNDLSAYSSPDLYSAVVSAVKTSSYNSSAETPPDGLVAISRSISKSNIIPTESSTITLTIQNNGVSVINNFTLIEKISKDLVFSDSSEITIDGNIRYVQSAQTAEVSVDGYDVDIAHYSKNALPMKKYYWTFTNFPPGQTITIKYNIFTYVKNIYYFNQYTWKGFYNSTEYSFNETDGDLIVVEMPEVTSSCYPYGKIVQNNFNDIIFSWPDAGPGYTYHFFVYKLIGSRLSLLYQNKFLTNNFFRWGDSGMLLSANKPYMWKVRAALGDNKGKASKLKFIPYNFDVPYIIQPCGIYTNSIPPVFKWKKINNAGYYKIRLYEKTGGSYKKIADYRTFNNINTASWAAVAVEKDGSTIPVVSGKNYKWDIKAVDGTIETCFSDRSSAEFTYYSFDGNTTLSPSRSISEPTSKLFNFSWTPVAGATSYLFRLHKIIGTRKVLVQSKEFIVSPGTAAASCEISLSPLSNYEWKIIPKKFDVKGNKSVATLSTFIDDPPEITAPIDVATSNTPVITWNKNFSTVRLRIKDGKNVVAERIITGGATSTDLAATPEIRLSYDKQYSFSLRGEFADGDLYTKWSFANISISRFEKPHVTSPADETDSLNPLFQWDPVTDAAKYKIIIKRKNQTVLIKDDITATNYTFSSSDADGKELLDGNTYTFEVCALSSSGKEGIYSDLLQFKVNRVGKPNITSPSSITLETSLFSWDAVADADAYIWTLREDNQIISGPNRTTALSYNYGNNPSERLYPEKTYSFEVKAERTIGGTVFYSLTSIKTFKSNEIPNPQPIYPGFCPQPIRYENIDTLTPLIQWTAVANAHQYELKIFDLNRKRSVVYTCFTENHQLTENFKLLDNTQYYFTVRARSVNGFSSWSPPSYFRTANIDTPELVYPNRTIYSTRPTFIVNAPIETTKLKISVYQLVDDKRILYKNFDAFKNSDTTEIVYYSPVAFKPDTRYSWTAQAIIINMKSNSAPYVNFEIAADASEYSETTSDMTSGISGFKVDSVTTNTISLSWDTVATAVRYNIYSNNEKYTTTTNNSIVLSSLEPNTKYIFSVSDEDLSGEHRKSPELKIWTLPETPSNIDFKYVTSNSFRIRWDRMDNIERYHVYIDGVKYAETSANNLNVTDIAPDSSFSVQVLAKNPGGMSSLSAPVIQETFLTPPDGLTVTNKNSTSFTVSWNAVPSSTQYHVYKNGIEYGATVSTSYDISGLEPNTEYFIEISSHGTTGEGARSQELAVKTTSISEVWKQASASAAFGVRSSHTLVNYDNRLWVIGGTASSTYKNDVYSSTDGITWNTETLSAGFSQRANHSCIEYDNKLWVIGGNAGTNYFNDVWSSVDGISWTEVTSDAAFNVRAGHSSVVFDNKMWVIGGFDNTNYLNDVWYSSDGLNWTEAVSDAEFVGRTNHSSVVFNNKMWIIGGNDSTNYAKDVWYSSNGTYWQQAASNALFGERSSHASFVFDDKIWLIGGQDSSAKYSDIWRSSDGSIWKKTNSAADFGSRAEFGACIYNNTMWVVGGNNSSGNDLNDTWNTE